MNNFRFLQEAKGDPVRFSRQEDFSMCKFDEINIEREVFSKNDFLLEIDYSSLDEKNIPIVCNLITRIVKFQKITRDDLNSVHDLVMANKDKTCHKIVEHIVTDTKTIFIGDVHGVLQVILFHFMFNGCFDNGQKYVFLGDIVDRGNDSLECLSLLMLLKMIYPKQIYLIRGNHETRNIYVVYGLGMEITKKFKDDIYQSNTAVLDRIDRMIAMMAIVVIVDKIIFCVHGCPSEYTPNIQRLEEIPTDSANRSDADENIIDSLLWSDPIDKDYIMSEISSRGMGYEVPIPLVLEYLKKNNLKMLVRAHQCVMEGYQVDRNQIMTLFGQPNYCGSTRNNAAMLIIDSNGSQNVFSFDQATMNSSFSDEKFTKEEPQVLEYFE